MRHWKLNVIVALAVVATVMLAMGGSVFQPHHTGFANTISKATAVADHSVSYDSPNSVAHTEQPLPVIMSVCGRVRQDQFVPQPHVAASQSTIRPPPLHAA